MSQRNQVTAEIASFNKLLKTQRETFALARKNLTATQRAIARTRARKVPLTLKDSKELDNALKTSHEQVSTIYTAIIAVEADLKSLQALLSRLKA
jgi:septal ring factor EnvC (AmiA/AmiB activator)